MPRKVVQSPDDLGTVVSATAVLPKGIPDRPPTAVGAGGGCVWSLYILDRIAPLARTVAVHISRMTSRRWWPREQLAVLIGLGVVALVLAVMLSGQALALLREGSEVSRRAMALKVDELSRTVALRTEYQLLTPMATALGRAAPGASSPQIFAHRVAEGLPCTCMARGGLTVRIDGATHPRITSSQSDPRDQAFARQLADTLERQVWFPHLSSANVIGRPDWPGGSPTADGRVVFGFLVPSRAGRPRLFGYMGRFAAADTIAYILATELDPSIYLTRALGDSTAEPGSKRMPVTFRTPPVIITVADAGGDILHADRRYGWAEGRRVLSLPTDVASLALDIDPLTPLGNPVDAPRMPSDPRGRLLTILVLFLVTVGLGVVAMVQMRREYALARRRTRFVSSVSHELRTPLAQIRLFAELLRDDEVTNDERRTEYARIIDEEAQRLTYFVDNVLAFTTLDAAAAAMRRNLVSLSAIVAHTVERFAPLAASRSADIASSVAPGVIISGNEDALRRIILNVLDNAVKYGPPGQTVRVEVGSDGAVAYVTVDDSGPGIPVRDRDRIFEPFVRLQAPGTAASGGSGIGLAIVRSLMRALDGTVSVEDARRGGTRIRLSFPLAGREPTRPEGMPEPRPARELEPA